MPKTRSYRKAKELAGESTSSDENDTPPAQHPPQPQPQNTSVKSFGFDDISNPGYTETFKVPIKGTCKYYVNTEIVQPRLNTDYYYKQKVKGVKHTLGCADPPRDPYQWKATIHQQVLGHKKKIRKLQGFNYLKQDPANTGTDTRFQSNNAEIIKEFKCIVPNCEAKKRIFKGLKVFSIVTEGAPRSDEHKMFKVEYTSPHCHEELPPTPGQGSSGVTTGVTLPLTSRNDPSNFPRNDDDDNDDDNPGHEDIGDDAERDSNSDEDTILNQANETANLEESTPVNTTANLETTTDDFDQIIPGVSQREGTPTDNRKNKAYNEKYDKGKSVVNVGPLQVLVNKQRGKTSSRNKASEAGSSKDKADDKRVDIQKLVVNQQGNTETPILVSRTESSRSPLPESPLDSDEELFAISQQLAFQSEAISQSTNEPHQSSNDPLTVNSGAGTSRSNVGQSEASDEYENLRRRLAIVNAKTMMIKRVYDTIDAIEKANVRSSAGESPLSRERSTSNAQHYSVSNLDLENISWPMYLGNPNQTIDNLTTDKVVEGSIEQVQDLDGWKIFSLDTMNRDGNLQKSKYHIMKKNTSKKGLFCAGDTIPKGTDLGIYPGRLISKEEFDEQFYTRSDHCLDIRNKQEELIGMLEPGQTIDILNGNNNLAFIKRARTERDVNVLPIAIKHTDGRILTHFMVTKDITKQEKLKTFFGPRKALIEDKIPLINFYNLLADRTTARVCAMIEREFMLTNPTYEPLYRKYFESIPGPVDKMAPESVRPFHALSNNPDPKEARHLFRLKESSIPNAGDGIFAGDKIERGTSFGPYPGVWEDLNVFEQYLMQGRQLTGYEFYVPDRDGTLSHVILPNIPSGRFKTSDNNWLLKINHDTTNTKNNLEPICDYETKNIYFSATKKIKKGEELLIRYNEYHTNLIVINEVKKDAFARIQRLTQRGS